MLARRPAIATLACGLMLAFQACGDGGRPSAAGPSPQPTATPVQAASGAASPKAPLLPDRRPARRGERATLEPLLQADAVLEVAAGEGLVAVAVGDVSGSRLMVGRATEDGPLALSPAEGAGTIPYWASIHVGRDASGDPIVAYPSCTSSAFSSCTPKTWSQRTRRETTVSGFERAGGVIEVAVDRGNAAVVATTDADAGIDDFVTSSGPVERVWAKRGDAELRRLEIDDPAMIALHGDTLATASETGADVGVCGEQVAQLWPIDDPAARPRKVGTVICGLGGSRIVSATLDAGRARFVIAGNGEDGHAETLTFDGSTGKTSRAPLGAGVADLAWISPEVGIGSGPPGSNCADRYIDTSTEPDPAVGPCSLSRVTLR